MSGTPKMQKKMENIMWKGLVWAQKLQLKEHCLMLIKIVGQKLCVHVRDLIRCYIQQLRKLYCRFSSLFSFPVISSAISIKKLCIFALLECCAPCFFSFCGLMIWALHFCSQALVGSLTSVVSRVLLTSRLEMF